MYANPRRYEVSHTGRAKMHMIRRTFLLSPAALAIACVAPAAAKPTQEIPDYRYIPVAQLEVIEQAIDALGFLTHPILHAERAEILGFDPRDVKSTADLREAMQKLILRGNIDCWNRARYLATIGNAAKAYAPGVSVRQNWIDQQCRMHGFRLTARELLHGGHCGLWGLALIFDNDIEPHTPEDLRNFT